MTNLRTHPSITSSGSGIFNRPQYLRRKEDLFHVNTNRNRSCRCRTHSSDLENPEAMFCRHQPSFDMTNITSYQQQTLCSDRRKDPDSLKSKEQTVSKTDSIMQCIFPYSSRDNFYGKQATRDQVDVLNTRLTACQCCQNESESNAWFCHKSPIGWDGNSSHVDHPSIGGATLSKVKDDSLLGYKSRDSNTGKIGEFWQDHQTPAVKAAPRRVVVPTWPNQQENHGNAIARLQRCLAKEAKRPRNRFVKLVK